MRILSLDLGEKSLGISISDEMNLIAIPLENFIFETNNFNLPLEKIISLTKEYKIKTILLGYPLRTDGKKSDATIMVDNFFELLKNRIDKSIKIKLYDERFSTQRGIEILKNKYKNSKDIKDYKDMAASYVMLMDFLSYNND